MHVLGGGQANGATGTARNKKPGAVAGLVALPGVFLVAIA